MADSERRARLIIETKNESSAQTNEINKGFGKMFESITGLNLASVTAAGAIGMVGFALKDSVDKTVVWADEMDKMARITGMSTEEASKLSVVMGDFGIGTDRLTVMIKKLTKEGIELNVDTLKRLAAEYQSLPSAVEKNEFAVRNFGRAGLEMTEILSKTPAQIDALTAAAERSGKVMNEQAVEAAQAYKLQLAQLNDQVDGLKITIGSKLIPVLSDAVTAEQNVWKTYAALGIKVQEVTGLMDENTASVQAAELMGKSHAEALKQVYAAEIATADASDRASAANRNMADTHRLASVAIRDQKDDLTWLADSEERAFQKTKDLADAQVILAAGLSGDLGRAQETYNSTVADTQGRIDELRDKLERLGETQGGLSTHTADNTGKIAALHAELDPLIEKQEAAAVAARKATDQFIYQQLSASLDADSALRLAEKLGLIDPASAAAAEAALELSNNFTDAEKKTGAFRDAAKNLADAIASLQSKHIQITTDLIYYEERRQSGQGVYHEQGAGGLPGGAQHGADFIIPPGFNENFPIGRNMGASSGERVTVTPTGQAGPGAELIAVLRALPGEMRRAMREA